MKTQSKAKSLTPSVGVSDKKTINNAGTPAEDDVLRRMLATPPKPVKKPPAPAK